MRNRLSFIALALALGLGACDGTNAFQPSREPPSVTELEAPATVAAGGTFTVFVGGEASVRIDSLVVMVEGAGISERRVATGGDRQFEISEEYSFTVPGTLTGDVITVQAFVIDALHRVSEIETRSVNVVDETDPAVVVSVDAGSVRQGGSFGVGVQATDNFELRYLGVEVRDPSGAVIHRDSVSVSGAAASTNFTVQIPEEPAFGSHQVIGFARDAQGNRGVSSEASIEVVFVDVIAPEVSIQQAFSHDPITWEGAEAVVAGDSIRVEVRIGDNVGVTRMRIRGEALVGNPDIGNDVMIPRFFERDLELPGIADSVMTRYLYFDLEAREETIPITEIETILVIVEVEDEAGLTAMDTTEVRLAHDIVPPTVTINTPEPHTVYALTDTIELDITISDDEGPIRSGVTMISIEFKVITGNAVTGDTTVVDLLTPASVDYTIQDLGRGGAPIVSPFPFSFFAYPSSLDVDDPDDPEDPVDSMRTFEASWQWPSIPGEDPSVPPDHLFFMIATVRDVMGNVATDTVRVCLEPQCWPNAGGLP